MGEDFLEQGHLSFAGFIPTETTGKFPGVLPVGQGLEEIGDGLTEGLRGAFLDQSAGTGFGDQFGAAAHCGGDHGRTAGHGFQEDVGPAFAGRGQHQGIGCAVMSGQLDLGHVGFELHPGAEAPFLDEVFKGFLLGARSDDEQVE